MNRPHILSRNDLAAWASLLVLPACTVAAAVAARAAGGPMWLWFNLDPDYFYLLDAVNLVNLTTPGTVYHPGATVHWLAALVLKAAHPLSGGGEIADAVLADPERHLRLISDVFVAAVGVAAVVLGVVAWRTLGALAPAWMLQLAPLLSMVVVKNVHHVKPEPMEIVATLLLMAIAVTTLEGDSPARRHRLAVAFGVVAGFGVASKVTALPVFVLPLLVLGSRRAAAVYGVSALAALVTFTLPMAGAYDVFFAWMAKIAAGSGAYGGGAGIVDWAAYPKHVGKLLVRPVLHLPLALALATLAWAAWRRRGGRPLPAPETRLLAGTAAAQIAQVLLVAKQPTAMYLIPAYMLSALTVVVAWRLWAVAAAECGGKAALNRWFAVLLAALVAAQGAGVVRLTGELAGTRARALAAADDGRFAGCVRVYFYSASSPAFALMLADFVAGSRFADRLAERQPSGVYWLEHWWDQSRAVFRDWRGPTDAAVLASAPCAVFRGTHWRTTEPLLKRLAPELTFDVRCDAGAEAMLTRGVGCDGRPLGAPPAIVDRPGRSR